MSSHETSDRAPVAGNRYGVLLQASRKLSATLSADDLYEAIYRETAAALDASGFYLALHDQSRDLARIVFYADDGEVERVDVSYRGSDSEVFRTQQASIVPDGLKDGSLLLLGGDETKTGPLWAGPRISPD